MPGPMNTSTFSGSLAASPDARVCRISLRKWLATVAARFREEIARRQLARLSSSWRFACAVELERARAERHGGSFSLVVLLTPGSRRADLAPVIDAAGHALKPGGHLAFTVERRVKPGYAITRSGRYAHSPGYVRRCARRAGLREVRGRKVILRYGEAGAPEQVVAL